MNRLGALLLLTFLYGCDQRSGGSLEKWMQFEADAISAHAAPDGAWGGRSYIEWTAGESSKFSMAAIKAYAASHHFTHVSDHSVGATELVGWTTSSGDPIFPLSYDGFDPSIRDDEVWAYFPRHIGQDAVVMKFDSNWRIAIGGVEKPAYAYGLLSADRKKLSFYHLWGE